MLIPMILKNKAGEIAKRIKITVGNKFQLSSIDRDTVIEFNANVADFCLGEKEISQGSCDITRSVIESTYAENSIRVNAPKVNVHVRYHLSEVTEQQRSINLNSETGLLELVEEYVVTRDPEMDYIPLRDIYYGSNESSYWRNSGNEGFGIGNDGTPPELIKMEITLTVEEGGVIEFDADEEYDEGAFCVSDDGLLYNALIAVDQLVNDMWTTSDLHYGHSPTGQPVVVGLVGDKPFEKSKLRVVSDHPEVISAELVDYPDHVVGLKITPLSKGSATVTIFVEGKERSIFYSNFLVYDKYSLTIKNPLARYQPQNASIPLSTLEVATVPENNVIQYSNWWVAGLGNNNIIKSGGVSKLSMNLGVNEVVCQARDSADQDIRTSFTVESYATNLKSAQYVEVFEDETFEIEVKFSTRNRDTPSGMWVETLAKVPEEFNVVVTNGWGVKVPQIDFVEFNETTGKYRFRLNTELLDDWNGNFYATLVSKTDDKNFAVSNGTFAAKFKYRSPSMSIALDKTSVGHYDAAREIKISGKLFKVSHGPITVKMGERNITLGGQQTWKLEETIQPNPDGTYSGTIAIPDMYDGQVLVSVSTSETGNQAFFDYVAPMIVKIQGPAKILITGDAGISPHHKVDWDNGAGYTDTVMLEYTDSNLHTVKIRAGRQAEAIRLHVREYVIISGNINTYVGTAIKEVVDWGRSSNNPTVSHCGGLTSIPATLPTSVTSIEGLFRGCPNFNFAQVSDYDISRVTNVNDALAGCANFNRPLNWDYSAVKTANGFLSENPIYNQPMNNANFGKLTSANEMLYNSVNFEQNLSTWCVSLLTETPRNFCGLTKVTVGNYPVWGTCPAVS